MTQVENAVYSDAEGSVALANSRGFSAGYEATQAWAYASAFAGEGADLMTGLGVQLGRDPDELDAEAIGARGRRPRARAVGARQPESRRCPVVLDAFVAASFIGFIGAMLSPTPCSAAARCSPVARATRSRTPRWRWPTTPPTPTAPRARPSTARARPRRRTPLIGDGRLLTFLFDARTAAQGRQHDDRQRQPRLLPLAAVGGDHQPGPRARGRRTSRTCSREAGDGLFVTDVAGLHSGVNPVSGTFSVGASGRLIEGASWPTRCAS